MALGELLAGLGVNTRVLMIGAHPDDEDTNLITWLQRGRYVETAYLSLTRGDGGQNLIGNELGEALGVIRTEELLAARRIDGARQYFTRAFDFGFSKDTVDTYRHWTRDSILSDVVRVVRAFRPHVIVAVFSGTTRDGHGHHQVSGLLARAAYDLSGDTLRFPVRDLGTPWVPLKFYRAARGNQANGTLGVDVGEYSPLLGRSFGEIAGESRSQHKSQGFGALERKGPIMNYVRREASRVNEGTVATTERSLFDGVDTSMARFRPILNAQARGRLDSITVLFAEMRAFNPYAPNALVPMLVRALRSVRLVCPLVGLTPRCDVAPASDAGLRLDLALSVFRLEGRIAAALRQAAGIEFEALASRDAVALGVPIPIATTVFNRGSDTIAAGIAFVLDGDSISRRPLAVIAPASASRDSGVFRFSGVSQPWWQGMPRVGAMFATGGRAEQRPGHMFSTSVIVGRGADTVSLTLNAGLARRFVDPVRGELERAVAGVPEISVSLGQTTQYVRANDALVRDVEVRLRSADDGSRDVRVSLTLPSGLRADSASRTARLERYGAEVTVAFRVRGRLSVGEHRIEAVASSNGESFASGYDVIDYDHIRRQHMYRPATIRVTAVDAIVPPSLKIAYIAGVGDNVPPALTQLGIPTTEIAPADVARADLAQFSTVVVGPRAYDAHPELIAANPRLFDFARRGGTVVVQYGQYEMTQPGATPFPITINRPHDRVTHEDAPVTIDAPDARELTYPNRISAADFDGWVQERALYMPRTFDPAYRALLSMNDPNEAANRGAVLVAPLGDGLYIYTSLSFFRQLPAGVPGAARLFVNLLSAKPALRGATP